MAEHADDRPASFKDKNGRDWIIDITYGSFARIKRMTGCDILNKIVTTKEELPDPETCELDKLPIASRLAFDDEYFVNILFACCARDAEAAGITDIDFGESLRAEHCTAARDVFLEQVRDFFRKKPGGEPAVELIEQMIGAIDKFRQAETRVVPVMQRRMKAIAADVDRRIEDEILKFEAELEVPTGGKLDSPSPVGSA